VLDLGIRPDVALDKWTLSVGGEVEEPMTWDWSSFGELPRKEIVCDFHCVTTWSQFGMVWEGVPFAEVVSRVKPRDEARFVLLTAYDGYTTNVPYELLKSEDVLVATHWDHKPLSLEHGGPVRFLVPRLYAWKSAKFLKEIIFSETDAPGYWEKRGYSLTADPWTNDRFGS